MSSNVKQKRNAELVNLLRPEFQGRTEHAFAWAEAVSMFKHLPGLRGLWTGAVDQYGYIADLSNQGNRLEPVNTPLMNNRPLAPYIEFTGTEYLKFTSTQGGTVTGAGASPQVAYWDGVNTLAGDAGFTYDASNDSLTLSSAVSVKPVLLIENTNADALAPILEFYKNTVSPADNDDLGAIDFYGETSTGAQRRYAYILSESRDVTNGDQAGSLRFQVTMDATERNFLDMQGYNGSVNEGRIIFNQDGQDVDFRIEASGEANALFIRGSDGFTGIHTNAPDGILHVHRASAGAVTANANADEFIVENSGTGGMSILVPDANTGLIYFGSPSDNAAAQVRFNYTDKEMRIGTVTASGVLVFNVGNGDAAARFDASGNLLIGTATSPGGTNGEVIVLFHNGGDPTMPTDSAGLFSKDVSASAELFGVDEAGNVTQLTSHPTGDDLPFTPEPWEYILSTENAYIGKQRYIRIEQVARRLQELTGEQFIFDVDVPHLDWYAEQRRRRREAKRAGKEFKIKPKPQWMSEV